MNMEARKETLLESGMYDASWDGVGGNIGDLARRISVEAIVHSEAAIANGYSGSFDKAISVHDQAGLIHAALIDMFSKKGDITAATAHRTRRIDHLWSAEKLRMARDRLAAGRRTEQAESRHAS